MSVGGTVGENVLLTVNDPLMYQITAISIGTLNVEGTWRFAKDKGKDTRKFLLNGRI